MKMQFSFKSRTLVVTAAALAAVLCQSLAAQGLPPRATPADYQARAQAGPITFAADFAGHGVATQDRVFETENYVMVEVALFGPPAAHVNLSYKDFSLRINGKKAPLAAQPYESVFGSLKDPEWVAPDAGESKSKTSLGGSGQNDPSVAPVRMPMPLRLAMEQKVKKASIPEGDRVLPEAGLLFFPNSGKTAGIRSIELIYNGAAGKATLTLQ
jgi:hypothetical protein